MDDPDDTDPGLAGLSPEFQAMIGGMAGHAAQFAAMLERRSAAMSKDKAKDKDDEAYLDSYAELDIHEDMLRDVPRVESYRKAIEFYGAKVWNSAAGTTVVDVGSGTGLLAVFCARAGAGKVHAVEASRLAHYTRQIAQANAPGVVQVHECLAEDLDLGAEKCADVIVSEWMGYFLLFENMLPSVLAVRDRYLKPGGLMLPSRARLYVAPLQDGAWRDSKIEFWRSVSGVDMSALVPLAQATAAEKPQHRQVPVDGILAPAVAVLDIDLHTVQDSDLNRLYADLAFEIPPGRRLDGFASWFDTSFGEAPDVLSTAPAEPLTHWRQTAFYFRQPLDGGGGVQVDGSVLVERLDDYSRGYRVNSTLGLRAESGASSRSSCADQHVGAVRERRPNLVPSEVTGCASAAVRRRTAALMLSGAAIGDHDAQLGSCKGTDRLIHFFSGLHCRSS
eukprot:CAMPEP_0170247290 /NCGR_PEP_ID=MMETSP0116_2-20130129/23433_1 /TAXON_ID=400756 /ORGANISM="Durinskia baltica, Strain CSIRO CS-38" /LENGTH=447 /DNA_ID=CAMNT_0010498169 /DNA_START=68 /DNA_END=1409 /DNA_ORIENTATION=+